ncbi:MAG: hypothetical protein HQM03_09675 [Magnetococcales bacterium]|nr:hypothetical protein [Magnetococcales bacterium]
MARDPFWWMLGLGLAVAAGWQGHLLGMPEGEAREWLIAWSGGFMGVAAMLVAVGVATHARGMADGVRAMGGPLRWGLALLAVGGMLHAGVVAPRTHRIFYDETIYLAIGQNLAHLGRAQSCHSGGVEHGMLRCDQWEYNKQPNGFPFLVGLVYRLFGDSEEAIFYLNNGLMGLAALVTALLTRLTGWGWLAGGCAGLVFVLIPQNAHWFNTTAAEPSAALFGALTVLAAFWYRQEGRVATLTLLTALAAWAISFRPESLLLLPLALLIVWGRLRRTPRVLFLHFALFWLLTLPVWLHLELFRHHPWGSEGQPFALRYFLANLADNGWHYISNKEFPAAYALLAMVGLLVPGAGRRERGVVGLWFLLFWGVFLFFYAGGYHYGADMRYALLSHVPLAVLAGVGAAWLAVRIGGGVVVTLLVCFHLPFLPLVRATTSEAWAARADHRYARQMADALPPESLVLTHNPNMFQVWGVHAAQMSLAQAAQEYVDRGLFPRYGGGVYLHYNFWCNIPDPAQNRFCQHALDRYDHEVVLEYREKEYRYALYRLRMKSAP